MNKRITSSGFFLCLACQVLLAATVVPDSLMVEEIHAPFRLLETERIPTGILTDCGVNLVDQTYYNGALSQDNYVNWRTLLGLLEGIKSSTVSGNTGISIDQIAESVSSQYQNNLNPVGIAVYQVNHFKEMTVEDRMVEYDETTDSFRDKYDSGTWVNPYDESYVVAFSPYMNVSKRAVTYYFSTDLRYSNVSIASIQFNAGNGGGYQTIPLNQSKTISVTYPAITQERTVVLKITLSDGTELQTHSIIQIVVPEEETSDNLMPNLTRTFTASQMYSGYLPTAKVTVKYANGHSSLENPFIVAEGFDPLSDPLGLMGDCPGDGVNNWKSLINTWPTDYCSKYDLVYIDWKMSVAPIEANADILRQVIQWVNQNKTSTNKNVLMGQSMGGLIARYALCAMEQDGILHDTGTYISDDAPHLGVNIPLGYVYLAQHLYDKVDNATIRFLKDLIVSVYRLFNKEAPSTSDVNKYYDELMALRNGPSVRQMMIDYVDSNKQWNESVHTTFLADLKTLGFPKGDSGNEILNLCMSNGGVNDFSVGLDKMMEASIHFESGLISDVLVGLMGFLWAKKRGLPSFFGVLCMGHTTIEANWNVYPYYDNGKTVLDAFGRYKKKVLWLIPVYHTLFSYYHQSPTTGCPLDDLNGSYYQIDYNKEDDGGSPYLFGEYDYSLKFKKYFLFVPTMSSLCYGKGNISVNTQDGKKNFWSTGVDWEQIPFDGYFLTSVATKHINVQNNTLWIWANRMMDLSLEPVIDETDSLLAPFASLYATEYKVVDNNLAGEPYNVEWSTSDSSVATVNQNGVITPVSNGAAFVYADIICLGGKMRLSRPVHITGITIPPEPDFSGFPTYVLNADAGVKLGTNYPDPISYIVTATAQSQVDTTISNHYVYKWGVQVNKGDAITWLTQTLPSDLHANNSIECEFYSSATARRVYFKVEYNGQESPTYSVTCRLPLLQVLLDAEGFVYSGEDQSEAFAQVKGSVEENYLVSCMGHEMWFNHFPSSKDICLRMLSNADFVSAVKQAKPWGNEDSVLIPIAYRKEEDANFTEDFLTFVFDGTL